jgi:transposase
MAKKSKRRCDTLPVLHPDAAGIDVGASELFVAVSADRDPHPVRSFPTFTRDLHALADWLEQCGIRSVAMKSTSVYWIPIYQILEARGLEVYLVNAQHVKNVPGRKTDVSDCQWLQYLHSVGLLRASFRPPGFICAVRSLWRHRSSLIQMAAEHVLHMQKALDQMNLQIHRVLNDITGVSSRRIMIMRFRPANIRLINRRSKLLRLLLALSSRKDKSSDNDKNNPTDFAVLTRSLHIRPKHAI